MRIIIVFCFLTTIIPVSVLAQIISSWSGPGRNGIYHETGLLKEWPEQGPEVLWTIEGIGHGYSSPSFSNGKIYLSGMIDRTGYVFIFNKDGSLLNSYEYGPEFYTSYPGSRSTPLVVDDLLYLVSGMGRIICLEADTGKEIWSRDATDDFGGSNIRWGITENLLIDGKKVFFAPGGQKHNIVALNRFTGEIIWSSQGIGRGDLSAYCSPLVVELPERKLFITIMASSIVGLDASTGEFLWSYPFTNRNSIHANTPLFRDGHIFAFSTDEAGSVKLKLSSDGSQIEPVWENKEFNPMHGGAVIVEDHIYAAVYVGRRWYCLDRETGEPVWSSRDIDRGVVIYADGRLYYYTERGELALSRPDPGGMEIISRTSIDHIGTGLHFSHPVILEGRLYVRRGDAMVVFDISR
jgi:outer membrane protein assembly factor BamB